MKAVYTFVLLLAATLPGSYASENIPIASTTDSDRLSPAMQYMKQLYRNSADENGNAKSASVSGLSVWCLVDKGELCIHCHNYIVQQVIVYRPTVLATNVLFPTDLNCPIDCD